MRRSKNLTLKDNLVIVCEGTETEFQYFEEIADIVRSSQPDRYAKIRVVPTHEENAEMNRIRHSLNHGRRQMSQGTSHPQWLYYVMEDHSQEEYDRYKEYPVRFVREAQLMMTDGGYTEAWAVYDRDVHTGHRRAIALSQSTPCVKIAFSSYSFEEWVLCHFERTSLAFGASKCKNMYCGHHEGCCGRKCLIGRIREKGYIRDFKKNMPLLFGNHLRRRMSKAIFNAAWLRHLDLKTCVWERNPYTDVDRLISDLIGRGERYEWATMGEEIVFEGCKLVVSMIYNDLCFTLRGTGRILLSGSRLAYCDEKGCVIKPILQANALIDNFNPSHQIGCDKRMRYLRLDEDIRYSPRKVYFIELPFFC